MTIGTSDSPMESSYEISWARPRIPPSREYLELEAQPPMATP